MVTAEMAPFAKVGGLGDVAEALSATLAARGHDVRVVLPLYGHLDRRAEDLRPVKKLPPIPLQVGQRMATVRFFARGGLRGRLKTYLVDCPGLYAGKEIYPTGAGAAARTLERWTLLARAALALPQLLEWPVDVVHAHDAGAAAAVVMRRQWFGTDLPGPGATVLTIHNLAHQEVHPAAGIDTLGLPRSLAAFPGLLEFHGHVNLLKGAIQTAHRVSTVSPTYARETTADPEFGCGLEAVLGARGAAYAGILNGADYATWDPGRDPALPAGYGPRDLAGKARCRAALLKELGLDADAGGPLGGFVGRLVHQKGVDLLLPVLDRLAADGFTFAILGTGDRDLEAAAAEAAARNPGRVAFVGRYDDDLAHRIYAGSDLFLMPSRFEPCGLSQMYALRYGTPPVVRRTGGLADTVVDAAEPDGTGFVFAAARPDQLLAALRRAQALREDPAAWGALVARDMACHFGWDEAAAEYERLYAAALADAASA
jgi:starch synthase